ncbi:MAG: hypothetical protein RSC80_01030 [Odoribacter sp.]
MKKIVFLTATALLFFAFTVNAQQRGPRQQREQMTPEQQATRLIERMNKELKLTDKQQADLKTWYTTSFKQRSANMEKNKGNREAMRTQLQKDKEANEAQIKKILTADQYKNYKAIEAKRMEARQQRPGNGGGRPQK